MLQVARLAPTELGESRDLIAAFLRAQLNPDGGFQDRSGSSDLYYTVFGLDALIALREELPVATTADYLTGFGDGEGLDLVHRACLARGWAALRQLPSSSVVDRLLAGIERHRTADGGYSAADSEHGTAYGAFLALGAYQDLQRTPPSLEAVAASIQRLRAADGSFGNQPGLRSGLTTATAAAVLLLRQLEAPIDRSAGLWLLDRCHLGGGFFASSTAPLPDLLSTATALHALAALHVPLAAVREPCLDFVDSLWTNRGGFFGNWTDDTVDCEYTYYALLALGHLSLGS
jgi:prenyltransferase beta subunit